MIQSRDIFSVTFVGLLIALGLFWLAVPRLGAQSVALPADEKIGRLLKGDPLSREEMRDLAANRERALRRAADPALSLELSEIYRTLWRTAAEADETAEARQAAALTRDATLRDLAARPLLARAWWRLALADHALAGRPTERSREALVMSVAVQKNAMSLVPVRLGLLLRHWHAFTPDQREAVKDQVRLAWKLDRKAVVRLARNDSRRALIRVALLRDPPTLAAFEKALAFAEARGT